MVCDRMPNFSYLIPRFIRHILPERAARFLLKRGLIIRPGLETRAPREAARRYLDVLASESIHISGSCVLILGYGGKFALACELLKQGASHVILAEKEGYLDHRLNLGLLPEYSAFLKVRGNEVIPDPQLITLLHGDIRSTQPGQLPLANLVFSNSVYEHLADVDGITAALCRLSKPGAFHIHYIDLRDHFFKYPFEMLCYKQAAWSRWLNPSSNHNRYRVADYRQFFGRHLDCVDVDILERDLPAFLQAKQRIQPQFLTGNDEEDSITLVRVRAVTPGEH